MNPTGKVAVITGAASGLGKATAVRLINKGARVIVAARDSQKGQAIADEFPEAAVFSKCDVTVEEEVANTIELAVNQFGRIDIIVSCAGTPLSGRTIGWRAPHDMESFKESFEVNVFGTFNMVRLGAFKMAGNEPDEEGCRGVIVMTASIAAFHGHIGQAAYAGSKAALVGMTLPIARDLASSGIRVCTICPGPFDTPMLAALSHGQREQFLQSILCPKRPGHPDEFAQMVEHIIRNSFLNAAVIRLDAGSPHGS